MLSHPLPNEHAFLDGGLIAASETANLGSGLRERRQVAERGGLCVALATQCLSKNIYFCIYVCMHEHLACVNVCAYVCRHVHRDQKGHQESSITVHLFL